MIEKVFIQKSFNKMDIEDYVSKKIERAGFSKLEIIKTPLVTRIVLHVARPGLAIGKSGATIKQLTETIAEKYNVDNPQIEIQEIKTPNLNAKILAEKMASMIERGFAWRSVSYRTVKDIMGAGAQGVELVFKGKLAGKGGRKRKQRIAMGYMKKIGDQSKYVDTAKAAAYPKAGAIGITLSIIHPDVVFPDKIDVKKVVEAIKGVNTEAEEQKEVSEETKTDEEKKVGETTTKEAETKDEKKEDTKKVEKEIVKKDEKKKEVKEEKETKKEENKDKGKEGLLEKIADKIEDVVEEVEEVAEKVVDKIEDVVEEVAEKIEDVTEGKDKKKEEKK
jgi:small subunit ribosomal protein S3